MTIPFARKCEHRIRACFHTATNQTSEVNAQEGKLGVRHRVDEVTHQVLTLRPQFVVFATKRHDLCRITRTRLLAYAIGVQAGAVDDEIGFAAAAGGLDAPCPCVMQLRDFGREAYFASLLLYFLDERVGDSSVIDNAFLRNTQCRQSDSMGFY